jgi:hypothetical protein
LALTDADTGAAAGARIKNQYSRCTGSCNKRRRRYQLMRG